MKVPFNKTRQLSTASLPGVVCDPILTFEFAASPSYALVHAISTWLLSKETDWEETRRLASELITAVIIPDGTRCELGTVESIDELAAQTDQNFIINILNGWNTRISLERIATVKKLGPSLEPSPASGDEKPPQRVS